MKKALVSVTGVDKTGIIAKVSMALYEININVLDISQTILSGYFTMLMIVDLDGAKKSFGEIGEELSALGDQLGVVIHIQRTDIFDAMHRV